MRIEEQHPDVLQNIEHAVAAQFRRHPEMTDYSVMRTYEALIDLYAAEKAGRSPRVTERAGVESIIMDVFVQ